ncbi:hypothetical protein NCCP2495_22440 [Dietzia sp. NCCP-2495]|nr:hypothetical protein NCCP2495_22440 [Dietzia sp. NCCP-2495]
MIAVEQLGAPALLQSLAIDGVAMLSSTLTGVAVALTSSRSRAFAVRLGAVLLLGWIASMAAVYAVPSAWLAVSVASLTAPLLMSAFALSSWLPWVLLALGPARALVLLPWPRRALPPRVLAPAPGETEAGASPVRIRRVRTTPPPVTSYEQERP